MKCVPVIALLMSENDPPSVCGFDREHVPPTAPLQTQLPRQLTAPPTSSANSRNGFHI
ncbi:hypothetical protein NPIL_555621, partial [Nephila pilipes]